MKVGMARSWRPLHRIYALSQVHGADAAQTPSLENHTIPWLPQITVNVSRIYQT
ncbi:hypothetical protein DPMN_180572 [Dreissena polymorpha]|uniref:Uncharacterized protein n=1 Tax=Dreissena polymorpha TaxID=45954 RepID=A0A9D4EG77_DREPO|nr:hypothetical protein DPMN_180572 [Dreissena polymorpha]